MSTTLWLPSALTLVLIHSSTPDPDPRPRPSRTLPLTRCPVAFCTAELRRPSAVVLDDALKAKLAQLPPEAEYFWNGPHGEVQSANPINQAALPSGAPRKRKRAELKKEPHPS